MKLKNQVNKKIKVIRSDRGGEYEAPIGEFCAQHEIIHESQHLIHLNQMVLLNVKIAH